MYFDVMKNDFIIKLKKSLQKALEIFLTGFYQLRII